MPEINGLLMKMQQRVIASLSILFLLLFLISCKNIKNVRNNIHGKWIETRSGSVTLLFDSSTKSIIIDYSANGGRIFSGKYSLNQKDEIESKILPRGARVEFDKKGIMSFYPLDKKVAEDIEMIYAVRFKKAAE